MRVARITARIVLLEFCETEQYLHRGNLGMSKSGLNLRKEVRPKRIADGRLRMSEALKLD